MHFRAVQCVLTMGLLSLSLCQNTLCKSLFYKFMEMYYTSTCSILIFSILMSYNVVAALSRSNGSYPSSVVSPAHRGFPQPSVNQQRDSNNHHQPHHNLAADHERRESNNPTFNSQHRGGGGDSTAPTVPPPPVPTRHSQP